MQHERPSLSHVVHFVAMNGLSCGVWAPEYTGSVVTVWAQLLCSMWDPSSLTRDWTCIPCIGRQTFNHWTTRGVSLTFEKVSAGPRRDCCGSVGKHFFGMLLSLCVYQKLAANILDVHKHREFIILSFYAFFLMSELEVTNNFLTCQLEQREKERTGFVINITQSRSYAFLQEYFHFKLAASDYF